MTEAYSIPCVCPMKIAVTGCNGRVGKRVVALALRQGHNVIGIDRRAVADDEKGAHSQFTFIEVDLKDYEITLEVLEGCEGVVHLAAFPDPGDYTVTTHNR